jgi:cell fate (sporulation/competence/biofilm development) regulator YlbF (YheA/YmcA/DUF963 family)
MNVYDKANELVKAMKESAEYKNMDIAQQELSKNLEHVEMVKDFIKAQINIQTMTMLKQEVSDDVKEAFNIQYMSIMNIENCRRFIEAQNVFGRMLQDIYKIIGEASEVMGEMFKDLMPY